MFCPQCGATNADNAAVCAQCGRNFRTPATIATPLPVEGTVIPPGATVPNYLAFALFATICCCLLTGIPAIVYAGEVNTKLQRGDWAGAQAASNKAKLWCWISVALGLATVVIFALFMVGMIATLRRAVGQ